MEDRPRNEINPTGKKPEKDDVALRAAPSDTFAFLLQQQMLKEHREFNIFGESKDDDDAEKSGKKGKKSKARTFISKLIGGKWFGDAKKEKPEGESVLPLVPLGISVDKTPVDTPLSAGIEQTAADQGTSVLNPTEAVSRVVATDENTEVEGTAIPLESAVEEDSIPNSHAETVQPYATDSTERRLPSFAGVEDVPIAHRMHENESSTEPVREVRTVEHVGSTNKNIAGAVVGGVFVAEALSRHRDRKIRRDVKSVRRELHDLKQGQRSIEQRQQSVPRVERSDSSVAQRTPEREFVAGKASEIVREKTAQQSPEAHLHLSQERQNRAVDTLAPQSPTSVDRMKPEQVGEILKNQYSEVRPDILQKQIEKAVEQNVAIEGLFERSHEVKDDQTATAQASSNGDSGGYATHSPQPTDTPPQSTGDLPQYHSPSSPLQYADAVKQGAAWGLVIIVLGIIAWLIVG